MLTRRNRTIGVALTTGVVATLAGVAGFIAAGPAGAAGDGVLRLHEKMTSTHLSGATNSRPAQGDQFVFTSDVFAPSGAKVGTGAGVCTVVSTVGSPLALCQITRSFAQGQVVATGMTPFGPQKPSFTNAIVGGTGRYRGSHGTETVTDRPNAPLNGSDITLRFKK
jgi:hypothetical protein